MDDVEPGEAEDLPARGGESAIALGISGSVQQGAVVFLAVGFYDDPVLSVDEVDATDPPVGVSEIDLPIRLRETAGRDQVDELLLEYRRRSDEVVAPRLQDGTNHRAPTTAACPQVPGDAGEVDERQRTSTEGRVDGPGETRRPKHRTEVEERPRHRRDRNAVDPLDMVVGEQVAAMLDHPWPSHVSPGPGRDLDDLPESRLPVKSCRTSVGSAAGAPRPEQRRHDPALERRWTTEQSEDAVAGRLPAPGRAPMRHHPSGSLEEEHLLDTEVAKLSGRELLDAPIDLGGHGVDPTDEV